MFSKYLVLLFVTVFSWNSFAILDFLAEEGKDASELIAYSTALSDLIMELDSESSAKEHSKNLNHRIRRLDSEIKSTKSINQNATNLLEGPKLTHGRVVENINSLTRYIQRLKALMVALGALGTQGAIAINTADTNRHLFEIQKNQQTQLLMLAESQVQEAERSVAQRRKWDSFLSKEKERGAQYALGQH
jgi:hypothetical protein